MVEKSPRRPLVQLGPAMHLQVIEKGRKELDGQT